MNTISLNYFQKGYRKAIEASKVAGIVWLLQKCHNMSEYQLKKKKLSELPIGTIGYAVANILNKSELELIPRFESHDLKHVLLGYGMTPEEEVKMQAFLLGNGNWSVSCILFLSLGIFMPEIWNDLINEYKKGKNTKSILHLNLDNSAHKTVYALRVMFGVKI